MTQPLPLGPKLVEVPTHLSKATRPKTVDFTHLDMYPSKYKIINGKVHVRSFILEDIARQHELLVAMDTTVMIGDNIKVDLKFGHYENGEWIDYYVKGVFKVKELIPMRGSKEILFLVTEVLD